jgi:hypothetical protein
MPSEAIGTHRSDLVLVTTLLAAMVACCTQGQFDASPNPPGGSGSSVPGAAPIDYHGFPYNIQAG